MDIVKFTSAMANFIVKVAALRELEKLEHREVVISPSLKKRLEEGEKGWGKKVPGGSRTTRSSPRALPLFGPKKVEKKLSFVENLEEEIAEELMDRRRDFARELDGLDWKNGNLHVNFGSRKPERYSLSFTVSGAKNNVLTVTCNENGETKTVTLSTRLGVESEIVDAIQHVLDNTVY